MGDLSEDYKFFNELKKERHKKLYDENLLLLKESKIPFQHKGTVCLFRESSRPKVDFYPHTGRWKAFNRMFGGGARKFLIWYEQRK